MGTREGKRVGTHKAGAVLLSTLATIIHTSVSRIARGNVILPEQVGMTGMQSMDHEILCGGNWALSNHSGFLVLGLCCLGSLCKISQP